MVDPFNNRVPLLQPSNPDRHRAVSDKRASSHEPEADRTSQSAAAKQGVGWCTPGPGGRK
eukprot:8860916-Prorocentrum_lima.AAC.1